VDLFSRLDVQALTRDQDGGGWGYFVALQIRWGIKSNLGHARPHVVR
jgi:hypothetical protein